jgi:hypothetical protein
MHYEQLEKYKAIIYKKKKREMFGLFMQHQKIGQVLLLFFFGKVNNQN